MEIIGEKLIEQKPHYDVWEVTIKSPFRAQVLSDPYNDGEADDLANAINSAQNKIITSQECRTKSGDYIGNRKTTDYLVSRGIEPETMPGHKVCSIGFCEREQKWYGWSHRAIFGFGIGDEVQKDDCTASSGWTEEYLEQHPEADMRLPVGFKAKTLDDAKRMAIAFAESVG